MENTRYGGGMCCPYCGEYISNAGFQMRIHQATCPKTPWVDESEISPVDTNIETKIDILEHLTSMGDLLFNKKLRRKNVTDD